MTKEIWVALAQFERLMVVEIAILRVEEIQQWFRRLQRRDHSLAFTLKKRIQDGEYELIQGIYDIKTCQITMARELHGRRIEAPLGIRHREQELIIYD